MFWSYLLLFVLILQLFTYGFGRALFWQLNIQSPRKRRYGMLVIFLFSNGIVGLTLLRVWRIMFRISANWLILMLFVLFTAALIWLLYVVIRRWCAPEKTHFYLRMAAPVVLLLIYALALYNAYVPVVRHLAIEIDKPLAQPLRIGLASDLHLGQLFGNRQLAELANIMQREQVDVILLAGDIMDDDTEVYVAQNMKPHLAKLRAPFGTYATLGNHDLFGHSQEITRELEAAGVRVLYDEAVQINGLFWLIGRPDKMDRNRLPTAQLLNQTDTNQAVILIDHRPDEVEQHAQLPIDLQVSGHVHNGQVFPANLIVKMLNRIAYGYDKINNSHFVVTSGYGFWGVPFRLGSQSEVWIIDVTGRNPHANRPPEGAVFE